MFNLMPWKKNKEKARELVSQQNHPLAELRDEFDALFDRFLGHGLEPFGDKDGLGSWALDVEEGDQEVVVRAEAPGFEPGELDVQVSGNLLTVKAEKKEHKQDKEGKGRYEEQRHRKFYQTMTLPSGIDPSKIEARYKNGLLEVHVPRSEEARAKRISIQA